jgi:hypothetical protein
MRYRETLRELSQLTDRELDDLGIGDRTKTSTGAMDREAEITRCRSEVGVWPERINDFFSMEPEPGRQREELDEVLRVP